MAAHTASSFPVVETELAKWVLPTTEKAAQCLGSEYGAASRFQYSNPNSVDYWIFGTDAPLTLAALQAS